MKEPHIDAPKHKMVSLSSSSTSYGTTTSSASTEEFSNINLNESNLSFWQTPFQLPAKGRMTRSASANAIQEDSVGLLEKGLSAAKAGATRLIDGAQTMVSTTQNVLLMTDNGAPSLSSDRLIYFGLTSGCGVLLMFLAFLTLPMIVFAPSKFALLFTFGSLCCLMSLGFIKGFQSLLLHLLSMERIPFTATYIISLVLTLYVTLFAASYFLALLFSIVQLCALIPFVLSYIPGGTTALKFGLIFVWRMGKRLCKCDDSRDICLPI